MKVGKLPASLLPRNIVLCLRRLSSGSSAAATFEFNTLIRKYSLSDPSRSLWLFSLMRSRGVPPDRFTFPFLLKSRSKLRLPCRDVHALLTKLGFDSDLYAGNALVSGYGTSGSVRDAAKMFKEMPNRDLVTWTALIGSYCDNGQGYDALELFREMQIAESFLPDEVMMLSVVSAISGLGLLELGRWVDVYVRRRGIMVTVSLGTALVEMYSRCGSIEESMRMFSEMTERNIKTWTAAISGLAVHGRSTEALMLFHRMTHMGVQLDSVTFSAVLTACSHGGLVDEARTVFKSMKNEHGIEPKLEHYGCMVDTLGRAGHVNEAYDFVEGMPVRPNSVIWRTLLGACVNHKHVELAERAIEKLREIDPDHDGDYVLLSNVYGGQGCWSRKALLRSSMREKRIAKDPGISSIYMHGEVYEFASGENLCPRWQEIRRLLLETVARIKLHGYIPRTSSVLHDVEDEEKEANIGYHSEKIAVAFGLLCEDDGKTLRITKNLRICEDCHSFMKHVSSLYRKQIIVRDRNRFHHFSEGSCSCQDFW
ncbi:hypothetical protein MLD38_004282 [Melastoma candidum]|uniref:Uncharacterized protein n=2 Tax=Melastoma candidum TaxID=119954 RepID=A0ACB9S9V0_9MYRT|nr:hypothetical protein MLD38_004282 [Melastoma candidum]